MPAANSPCAAKLEICGGECVSVSVWNVKGKYVSFVFKPALRQRAERYASPKIAIIMSENIFTETYEDRVKWWNSSRYNLNKGLLFGGLSVIVVSGLIFEFLMSHSSDNPRFSLGYLLIASVIYIFYIGLINMIYFLMELLDRTYIKNNKLTYRIQYYKILFWAFTLFPFIYPIFILTLRYR